MGTALEFDTIGTDARIWPLEASQVEKWALAFPGLDVMAECRKAQAWLDANPTRRKTPRGMPKFLVGWLTRATDSPRPIARPMTHTPAPQPAYADSGWFEECMLLHGRSCNGSSGHRVRMEIDAGRQA